LGYVRAPLGAADL
jgi:hypothetical protein